MHNQYFQGILQLRNPNKKVIDFIEEYHKYIKKKNKVKNGFDYYFISNKILRKLAKKLKTHFGGVLKESPRLYSRDKQTQKAVYRLSVLFRLLDFQKDDVIAFDNKIIRITNIGNKISGIDIKKKKRVSFLFKNISDYKILPVISTRIIKVHPFIEVLDEDYQGVRVEGKKKVRIDEKVKVVNFDGYWFV